MSVEEQMKMENFQKFLSYKIEKLMPELYKEFNELPKASTSNNQEFPCESSWTCPACDQRNENITEKDSLIRKCSFCREIVRVS